MNNVFTIVHSFNILLATDNVILTQPFTILYLKNLQRSSLMLWEPVNGTYSDKGTLLF